MIPHNVNGALLVISSKGLRAKTKVSQTRRNSASRLKHWNPAWVFLALWPVLTSPKHSFLHSRKRGQAEVEQYPVSTQPSIYFPTFPPLPFPPLHVPAASRWNRARRTCLQPWGGSRIYKWWCEMPGILRLVLGKAACFNWASELPF